MVLKEASCAAVHALLRYCYKPYSMADLSAELLREIETVNADLLGVKLYVGSFLFSLSLPLLPLFSLYFSFFFNTNSPRIVRTQRSVRV